MRREGILKAHLKNSIIILMKEKVQFYRSVVFKMVILVISTVAITIAFFAFYTIRTQRRELIEEAIKSATQLSETIKKGTYYDMLEDRRQNVYRTMETIAKQKGIEKIRIFNKEGKIMFSTYKEEIEKSVDKRAEACYACHSEKEPLEKLDIKKRTRIFVEKNGHRILGMITPIYNEPACWAGGCHYHPKNQSVLGVIDITLSLKEIDEKIMELERWAILFSIFIILGVSFLVLLSMRSLFILPIRKLLSGFRSVSEEVFDIKLPEKRKDEIGYLFKSFNRMVEELKKAKEETQRLIETLDHKVEEKTREVKEAQKKVLLADKLASLGRLAASIAHEINNPLSGIITYLKLILKKIENGKVLKVEDIEKYLLASIKELERVSIIVKNLLDFSKQREPEMKLIKVKDVIEEALFIIGNQLKIADVKLENKIGELPEISGDPAQLKQVFLNLFSNAIEAMTNREKKVLTIESVVKENWLEIHIVDTGIGIPEENLSKVFDPFFTTKERGTGLGLSVTYGIIMNHGGDINIFSKLNEGTRVVLKFPIVPQN